MPREIKAYAALGLQTRRSDEDGMVRCVAGFRISEVLAYGKFCKWMTS